jgi:type I restriction-modification system DNA methylase subunit
MNYLKEATTHTYVTHQVSSNVLNEQQLELFFSSEFSANKVMLKSGHEQGTKKTNLGQVFTPTPLALFMVRLIEPEITSNSRILDPCIGPNTFFSQLSGKEYQPSLVGIELDQSLITKPIQQFYSAPNRILLIDSFFNYPSWEKFDFIIQNPPYVRQELLTKGVNSKSAIYSTCSNLSGIIPSQST